MPTYIYRHYPIPTQRDNTLVTHPPLTQIISPDSIASEEAVGGLTQVVQILFPNSIGSDEAVSNVSIVSIVSPNSIGSDEGIGGLTQIIQIIFPNSIASEESVSAVVIVVSGQPIIIRWGGIPFMPHANPVKIGRTW